MCNWQIGRHDDAATYLDYELRQRIQKVISKRRRRKRSQVYPTQAMLLQLRREAEEMVRDNASTIGSLNVEQIP